MAKKRTRKQKLITKLVLMAVEVVLLIVVVVGFFAFKEFADLYSKIEVESEFENESEAGINTEMDSETKEVLKGYTNIALFGLDNRSGGNYDEGRSDSIMIASINNETKEVKLVSVFRDTYLSVGNGVYNKANTAYSFGGVRQAVQMLNSNLDLDITEYVCVDWLALIEAIDALGGVELDITSEEVYYINYHLQYMSKEIDCDATKVQKAGKQTLNGAQATCYARIRYTAGNDFKRASRQRIVLEAMLNKAKAADVTTLIDICKAVFDDISTTLSLTEIIDLAKDVASYEIGSTSGFPYKVTTKVLSGCGDCVIPIDLAANVSQLHNYMFGTENYDPTFSVKAIGDAIMEKTGVDEDEPSYNIGDYNNTAGQDGTVFD